MAKRKRRRKGIRVTFSGIMVSTIPLKRKRKRKVKRKRRCRK